MEVLHLAGKRGMNTKSVVFAITAMFSAFHCAGQSNVVYYGANSNALDVVFVDTKLSPKTKSDIVADLRVCLSEWGKAGTLDLGGYEDVAGYLYIGTSCPHYPEDIDFPRNIVSNGTSGIALQIPKDLSDAYKKAFAFAAANAFVEFVSSPNFLTLPPKNLPDYLLDSSRTTTQVIADAQGIISDLRLQTFYPPSVLSFFNSEIGPAKKNLFVGIPCSAPLSYSDRKSWGGFHAIWHKGKWKFIFWEEK
ncbi:MAG: hypothetical protein FWH21_09635 [Kiritimatiellaeota bacterium]|nr:hypothetical protein [Kiritimatiellota bacterium]